MPKAKVLLVAALLGAWAASAVPAHAQQPDQSYGDMRSRVVKALSEQQMADLRAGRGMGFALPAELNGYPGPIHVLEHADALRLDADQRARTRAMFEAMKAEAISLGERLIQQEAELERLFASRTVAPASLESATGIAAATQGALRATHLRYHLAMMDVLMPEQVRRYEELRGYTGAAAPGGGAHGHAGRPHGAH